MRYYLFYKFVLVISIMKRSFTIIIFLAFALVNVSMLFAQNPPPPGLGDGDGGGGAPPPPGLPVDGYLLPVALLAVVYGVYKLNKRSVA
ncbi:hypothetical protein SAMN05216480_101219 [Pustulibacterium marinum]|uniref:Uncharacterized protein n=1 Tax=Pustulibacterium marinum TaxID=1224947 RepID=A0A1I7EUF5_9FLAO|nr:hypothetical protein SAMN05216480_101219 [Pustulibacterium marinum]